MNRRHRALPFAIAGMLLLGLAGPASAAPPTSTPSFGATIKASRDCLLTVNATWKNASVGSIYVSWYEAGYQSPDYPTIPNFVATSAWPGGGPNGGVARGKSVAFTFGPTGTDTTTHEWWALVSFYDPNGVALPQVTTNVLSTICYLPSPA